MSTQFVHKIFHIPTVEQAESDAFLERIAACKTREEVREVIEKTKALFEAHGNGEKLS